MHWRSRGRLNEERSLQRETRNTACSSTNAPDNDGSVVARTAVEPVVETMKPLTLSEAADFLRMSRSSLYQRKDIPRYRRPGSRVMLFDQEELEAWLKQGRVSHCEESTSEKLKSTGEPPPEKIGAGVLEFSGERVYHRNARYR